MLFGTIGQGWVFLWMVAAGCAMGAWYAATAALRRLLGAGVLLSLFLDLCFALGAGVIFCLALIAANHGQMRLFAALGAVLGLIMMTIGAFPPAKWVFGTIYRETQRIIVNIGRYRWIKVILK